MARLLFRDDIDTMVGAVILSLESIPSLLAVQRLLPLAALHKRDAYDAMLTFRAAHYRVLIFPFMTYLRFLARLIKFSSGIFKNAPFLETTRNTTPAVPGFT